MSQEYMQGQQQRQLEGDQVQKQEFVPKPQQELASTSASADSVLQKHRLTIEADKVALILKTSAFTGGGFLLLQGIINKNPAEIGGGIITLAGAVGESIAEAISDRLPTVNQSQLHIIQPPIPPSETMQFANPEWKPPQQRGLMPQKGTAPINQSVAPKLPQTPNK